MKKLFSAFAMLSLMLVFMMGQGFAQKTNDLPSSIKAGSGIQGKLTAAEAAYADQKQKGLLPQPQQTRYNGAFPAFSKTNPASVSSFSLLYPKDTTFQVVPLSSSSTGAPLYRNDDGVSSVFTLPFTFQFYGSSYNQIFINNNGNISFGTGFSEYTSTGFPVNNFPMLAPFWADVDTRNDTSGVVYFKSETHRFSVIWDKVGYYGGTPHADKLNEFELIISDGTDSLVGLGNNVCFSFADMQWTTGDVSGVGAAGGFGGTPATVGINKGDGTNFAQVGRFDHPGLDYDGPGDANDGVDYLDGKVFRFFTGQQSNNVPPIPNGFPGNDVIRVFVGHTYQSQLSFLSPEAGQTTHTTVYAPGLSNFTDSSIDGNISTIDLSFTPDSTQLGDHAVSFTATDDGIPTGSTTVNITFRVELMPKETIIATAEPHGSISPSGTVVVDSMTTQSFTITPDPNYHIDSVVVDGVNNGVMTNYMFEAISANHTIHAYFSGDPQTIIITHTPHGSTFPVDTVTVPYGGGQMVYITPDQGYHVDSLILDGVPQTPAGMYVFSNVTANHTLHVVFALSGFTISASAGPHGSINPSGEVQVPTDSNQTFTFTPDNGYHVDSVIVDGYQGNPGPDYTFGNVQANHTLRVTFAPNSYTIMTSSGPNGSISPFGETPVLYGGSVEFTMTPDPTYHLDSLYIDGVPVTSPALTYTFSDVGANHTIHAVFAINTYPVTVTAGTGGVVTPIGVNAVKHGDSLVVTITPAIGHYVSDVLVDSVSVGAVTSYTISNVTAPHTIQVIFGAVMFTITASAGDHGAIDPSGEVKVEYGAAQAFTMTPATGYHVDSLFIDGVSQPGATTYSFTDVTAIHTIHATFAINHYTITASSGPNGSIAPSGEITLLYGQSQAFVFTPNTGYEVDSVIVDGIFIGSETTDTIKDIADNHTIRVVFGVVSYHITVTAGEHGAVTPSGIVHVPYNGNQTFSIQPNTGWHIDSVWVDGVAVPVDTSYTFNNVTGPHAIAASFAINKYTITATLETANGVIAPPGVITVDYGTDTTYRIQPNRGYEVDTLYIDEVGQDIVDSGAVNYTFTGVSASHTVRVVFDVIPAYRIRYRTFKYDSMLTKNPMRRKNVAEECRFTIQNTSAATLGEINFYFNYNISSVISSGPMTMTGARKVWKLTGALAPGESFTLDVMVGRVTPMLISRLWFGPAKGTPNVLKIKPFFTKLFLQMPNIANVRDSLWNLPAYIQDGFTIGVVKRDSVENCGWVVMRNKFDMYRSLYFSRKMHTDVNTGFLTFTKKAEPFTREHKELPPTRQNNKTFADLLVLKFSLALSMNGMSPAGLGELRYTEPGNPFAGMLVRDIAALGDSMMTLARWARWHDHPELYGQFDQALVHINEAFSGPIDTITWSTKLKLAGTARAVDEIYLEPTELSPTLIAPQAQAAEGGAKPQQAVLHQNYPNPFNPVTTIRFELPEDGLVSLTVYNILGQEVARLVNHEELMSGAQEVEFDASRYASGVYFYRLNVEPVVGEDGSKIGQYFTSIKKMMLVK